ncbi:MAG: iron-sulfur cluster assembly accessory protein [Rickettsiaceae bacterium]|nr:iron-sulfur cluster assembly accessory protein [Rickettsiaceae bacterium]
MRQVMSVTKKAATEVRNLLKAKAPKETIGIRIGVKSGGCSGLKYSIEFATSIAPYDEVVNYEDLTILIDPKALMYLLGTEMDYIEEKFKSGFIFNNPNEKSKCGCGSSFSV